MAAVATMRLVHAWFIIELLHISLTWSCNSLRRRRLNIGGDRIGCRRQSVREALSPALPRKTGKAAFSAYEMLLLQSEHAVGDDRHFADQPVAGAGGTSICVPGNTHLVGGARQEFYGVFADGERAPGCDAFWRH